MKLFESVKRSVTARQAAEYYGLQVNRFGKTRCPFHNDRTPSMKVDRRFHCFGCGADGDVIDFVSRLCGLEAKPAAEKLAADFHIPCEQSGQMQTTPRTTKTDPKDRQREEACFRELLNCLHRLQQWAIMYAPNRGDGTWHPLFVEAMQNMYTVLTCDPALRGAIRHNILTGRTDICKPLWWERSVSDMNDTDVNYIMLYLENRYGLDNENKIRRALSVAANQNRYHPIRDYLNSLAWDGTERIRYVLHHFLGAEISDYTYEVMKLFLMGAIHRVFEPGCKFELMLCLVGGQGAGKSTFFRFLACKDEWFSDDLKRIDDENVFRKMQGHWIIEMSEMIATASAKSIEDIKSFLSRSKETYKVPYATEPQDRLRQCVFGGTSNALDFLPLDRSGNRRFLPVMVHPEKAEVHILEDEQASRQYMDQLWAEAMTIYLSQPVQLKLSKEMNAELVQMQRQFMPEDTKVGMIQAFLDDYDGDMVCTKLLFHEALGRFDEPKMWEIREINDIMNQSVTGWTPYPNPRKYPKYGKQRGWQRETPKVETSGGFRELTEEECSQTEIPF